MKMLSSWFQVHRVLGPAILSFAMLCAFIALAMSTTSPTSQSTSTAPAVAVPACPANTIFSASFTGGQEASPEAKQQWEDFRQSLTPAGYDTVTINGTFDTVGRTLTDATVVPQIAAALKSGTSVSLNAGGHTWNVGTCGSGIEFNASDIGNVICGCTSPSQAYTVRPEIGASNPNWGGVNTNTCSGPSQTITVIFSGPGPATPPCATAPSGMVSWWPAEGDANDIQDGNDGTIQGTVTFAPGKVGQAFSFDGNTANYVFVPHNTNLDLTQFTVDAWVYPTANPDSGFGTVIDKEFPTGGINYVLFVGHDGTVEIDFNAGRHQFVDSPPGAAPQNTWTHIAGTYDGPNGSKTLKLYVNGVLIGTHIADPCDANGCYDTPLTGQDVTIGVRNANTLTGPFQGLIDEVEVIDHALTGAEVLRIYNAACTGKCRSCASAPGGMISWWKAEANTNDSEDNNNGTFSGTPAFSAGEVGQAFSFDGNSYVRVPDNTNLHFSSQFTLDAWVYPTDLSGAPIIFSKFGGSNFSYELHLQSGGGVRSNISGDGTTYDSLISDPGVVSTNSWAHVTTTFNAGDWRIYVNGVEVASKTSTVTSIYPGTSDLLIGSDTSNFFKGLIDEAEVFGRALTQSEVRKIYDAGSKGKCPCTP